MTGLKHPHHDVEERGSMHDRATSPEHDDHAGHDEHAGHDPEMFRRLFWWNLLLAVPVVVFSEMVQDWFGYSIDGAWAAWVPPVLGTVIYLWGGQPFLKGAVHEVRNRQPGMMLLIALAITVAYCASLASSLGTCRVAAGPGRADRRRRAGGGRDHGSDPG
jgi:Cu2+-exporting ATPase